MLDPIVVAQLGNLHIRARRLLEGLYSGRHLNRNRGTSKEFSQHRPYNPGDDPRDLDWKIFGKTDRLVLKQYEEETSLSGFLVVDDSASMSFHSGNYPAKIEYAKTMAAAMAYILVAQHDSVGLLSSQTALSPRTGRGFLDSLFEQLEPLQGQGIWDMGQMSERVMQNLKKRSLIAVFTDLMQDFETVKNAFKILRARKHDIIVFQILDPLERDLNLSGTILFNDMETGEKIKTEPESIRRAYREFVKNKLTETSHFFKGLGIEHVPLTTNTSFEKGLGAYLSWREARL